VAGAGVVCEGMLVAVSSGVVIHLPRETASALYHRVAFSRN
jgi:hypothetical protein